MCSICAYFISDSLMSSSVEELKNLFSHTVATKAKASMTRIFTISFLASSILSNNFAYGLIFGGLAFSLFANDFYQSCKLHLIKKTLEEKGINAEYQINFWGFNGFLTLMQSN